MPGVMVGLGNIVGIGIPGCMIGVGNAGIVMGIFPYAGAWPPELTPG
jgi:hypothetical protein